MQGALSPDSTASAQQVSASPDESAARRAFEVGRDAYDHGDFGDALAHFQRAYDLSKRPALLFNIARAADADGQLQRAAAAYAAYLEALPAAENRDFVRGRIDKIRAADASDAGSEQVAPPPALPSVAEAARAPSVPLVPAATTRSRPDEGEPARPVWKRGWFWAAAGAVVVGGAVGGLLAATRSTGPERASGDAYVLVSEAQ